MGGGLEPCVCATAPGLGRGLDGCEPEDLGLDSHRLEGLGRAPPVESRRTRRVAPHCGWSGSRRGPRMAVWAGGLDSRPRIEKVVGDAGAWLPQRRRRRLLVQVLEQRTGLARRHSPPREGQRALESREPVASAARLGWHGGGLLRRSTCAGRRARASGLRQARHALPSRGRRCRRAAAGVELAVGLQGEGVHDSSARARLLAATLAFHPREGGHTMPRSSRWARPPCCVRGDGVLGLRVRSCTG